MHNATLAIAARARIATDDLSDAVLHGAQRRLRDDNGAQAAEYAMLGGVSAAVCGALVALLRNGDLLKAITEAVVQAFTKAIKSWF